MSLRSFLSLKPLHYIYCVISAIDVWVNGVGNTISIRKNCGIVCVQCIAVSTVVRAEVNSLNVSPSCSTSAMHRTHKCKEWRDEKKTCIRTAPRYVSHKQTRVEKMQYNKILCRFEQRDRNWKKKLYIWNAVVDFYAYALIWSERALCTQLRASCTTSPDFFLSFFFLQPIQTRARVEGNIGYILPRVSIQSLIREILSVFTAIEKRSINRERESKNQNKSRTS